MSATALATTTITTTAAAVSPVAPAPTHPRRSTPTHTREPHPGIRAVPSGPEARGFALYVGIDEDAAAAAGTDLGSVVRALKTLLHELVPGSDSYAAVALAASGAGGRDVDVVRLALQEPGAVARQRAATAAPEPERIEAEGVVIDISRKRVLLDGAPADLTYREFELLQFLVLREGRTVDRSEIIEGLWEDADEVPGARTIDVHIRRLRAKLGGYEDVVRTVRGSGYRFDRHADVAIRWASAPSPDLF